MTAPVPIRSPNGEPDRQSSENPPAGSLAPLLARSALGDEAAFEEIYDATSARVFGLVLRLVRNHALAEEVTQEVYLQLWRTASRYDESRGSALSWLMTMTHRRAVDRIRYTEAYGRRDSTYHQDNAMIEYDETFDTANASLTATTVRSALASLSANQRHVLELAYFGGHTHTEVAEIVGIPLGTAKTRIRDGLIRLRTVLDDAA